MQTKKDLEKLSDDIVRLVEKYKAVRESIVKYGHKFTLSKSGENAVMLAMTQDDADIIVHALLWYGHKVTCRIRKLERRKAKEDETQSL